MLTKSAKPQPVDKRIARRKNYLARKAKGHSVYRVEAHTDDVAELIRRMKFDIPRGNLTEARVRLQVLIDVVDNLSKSEWRELVGLLIAEHFKSAMRK